MEVKEALASGQDVTVEPDGSAELAGVSLPGLPEGLLLVGYREADQSDIVLWNGDIKTGVDKRFGPQFIVKLAPGYDNIYDVVRNENHIVKKLGNYIHEYSGESLEGENHETKT